MPFTVYKIKYTELRWMKVFLSYGTNLRKYWLFIILLTALASGVSGQNMKPLAKLTLEEIVRELSVKKIPAATKNNALIAKANRHGIDFIIDAEVERKLRNAGANAALIKKLYEKSADVYFDRGYGCKADDYDCQIKNYTEAIKLDPKFSTAFYNRGTAYYDKKEYETAITDFNRAIELNPKYTDAYINRGLSYNDSGDYDTAIRDFDTAIRLDPKIADSFYNRALAYHNKGDFEQAILDGTEAIRLDPTVYDYYINRGISYFDKGDYRSAIKDYTKAIELNPNYGSAYYNRGLCYAGANEFDLALKDYTRAIEIDPNDADAYFNRALVYEALEDEINAEADRRKVEELEKLKKP